MTKLRLVLAVLAGSITVQVAVACGSSAVHAVATRDSGASAPAEDVASAIAEALGVADEAMAPEASAGPTTPPQRIVAPCVADPKKPSTLWAVADVPGRSLDSLTGTISLRCYASGSANAASLPTGFLCVTAGAAVRDGGVGTFCAGPDETVTFIIPAP